ncbi:sulfatase [Rubripirellula obstinata]|uniref:sulfatase n=1 Tax=Rubripirellula obstinata TaxID=406547 RepID=UPI00135952C1|nr:sulfatase [Rubripirellula obstinata]
MVSQTATAQNNNNVILFTVDDLGWADNDLAYSQAFAAQRNDTDSFFETPNLRAMAQGGTTFTQAYSSSPVCSPSRASLMLGQTPGRHGITQWIGGPDERNAGFSYVRNLPLASTTIAEAFRGNGYATAQSGKWHLGEGNQATPLDHGFDENYGGGPQGTPGSWYSDNNGGFAWANNLPGGTGNPAREYLTDRLTRDAVSFINSNAGNPNAADNKPFFLNLSHYGVHTPINAPQALRDKYEQKLASGGYEKFDSLTALEKTTLATYAAMVESVDQSLGAVRQALVDNGIDQNTTVAFISDHGGLATELDRTPPPNLNGPLRNGKGTLYEGGIRVPVLISGPGVVAGQVNDTPIIGHDLFPTLLQSAGVALPNQTIDGVDLSGMLAGGGPVDRGDNAVVIHYPHRSPQGGFPSGAIIDGKSKLIQSYDHGGIEVYNLANDISETTDLERIDLDRTEDMRVEFHRYLDRTNSPVPTTFTIDTRHAGKSIPVANGDFELNAVTDNLSGGPGTTTALREIANWTWVNNVQLNFGGLANPDDGMLNGPDFVGTDGDGINGAMDGPQIVYFGSFTDTLGNNVESDLIGIEQTLDARLIGNGEYTVRFAAAARGDQGFLVDGLVRLLAGDTVIGEFETPEDLPGLFRDYQFIVDASTLDRSLVGQSLKIQLFRGTDGGKVSYDNIRLFTTAIPEPGSFGFLTAIACFISKRNRRKSKA